MRVPRRNSTATWATVAAITGIVTYCKLQSTKNFIWIDKFLFSSVRIQRRCERKWKYKTVLSTHAVLRIMCCPARIHNSYEKIHN
jgi:ABC-type anion transport system duplicated permease subunit